MGCGASSEVEKDGYAFRVRLLGGLNLYNNGFSVQTPFSLTDAGKFAGASDPYCYIECSGSRQKYESSVQYHTQNPVWNEEFYFNCFTKTPMLTITVKDKDVLSGDDVLGVAKIRLYGLLSKEKERTCWTTLEQKGDLAGAKGEIGIAVVEAFRTTITAKQGINVKPMDALSGSSDCYMMLTVGQQEPQKTTTKGWTLNPVWNEPFRFYLPYGIKSQVGMVMYDHDTVGVDKNMGWHYEYFDGVPKQGPRDLKVEITNAQGSLEFVVEDNEKFEGVAEPEGPVTDEIRAKFPPEIPTSCVLDCRVLGAYNLAASDHSYAEDFAQGVNNWGWHEFKEYEGTSDPFAVVSCEGVRHSTRHINNTLEPVWNERFRFVCKDRENGTIKVDVFDHDVVGNEGIGAVTIPLKNVKPGKRQEIWSYLDKGRGEVGVEVMQHHQLHVKVVKCDALPAKDLNGMCDPYIKLKLQGQEYKTRVVRNDRNPWFEEEFRFCVPEVTGKLTLECWDSDFVLFRQNLSEDSMGSAEIDVSSLVPGLPTEFTVPLAVDGRADGTATVIITEEIPVPENVLDELRKKGKEAFEAAVRKMDEAAEMVKCMKLPDFDNKEEAEFEVADPKLAPRPRFSRMSIELVAVRGIKLPGPWHVGVSCPLQGKRFKSKDGYQGAGLDFSHEKFEMPIPSRDVGAIELSVLENSKNSYTEWTQNCYAKHQLELRTINGGDGPIRGSPADDLWLDLTEGNGQIVVRVSEMFRFQIRVVGGTNIKTEKEPYVAVYLNNRGQRTSFCPPQRVKDDKNKSQKQFSTEPKWDEQFTFFAHEKGPVKFALSYDNDVVAGQGEFDLNQVRRGVLHKADIELGNGGTLQVEILEEEKMALLDRIFDQAENAKKLAESLASEVAAAAGAAVSDAAGAVTGALGKLF